MYNTPDNLISRGDHLFFRKLRTESFHGIIHSVFKKAFNIKEVSTGKLFTFCVEQGWIGPDTLNVPVSDTANLGLDVSDVLDWDGIYFSSSGKTLFSLDSKSSGNELFIPPYPANQDCIFAKKEIMTRFLESSAHSIFAAENSQNQDPFSLELHRMLTHSTTEFSQALLHDVSQAVLHGKRCLGLGVGLTPSGDDFLVGFFSVLHMEKSPAFHKNTICTQIVQDAPAKTTDISAAILANAASGRVLTLISDLLQLLDADQNEFLNALQKLISLGSSSGSDISWGILSALELNLKLGHNN